MWYLCFARLNHQDLICLLEFLGERIRIDVEPVTIRRIVRNHSENQTFKTIWLSSIQTYSTHSKNTEEIRKPL